MGELSPDVESKTAVPLDAREKPAAGGFRAATRRLGTVLIVLGALFLVYGAIVYLWRDPVTDLYARWKQHELAAELEQSVADYRVSLGLPAEAASGDVSAEAPVAVTSTELAVLERETRRAAQRFFAGLDEGQPLGRIVIPRLEIDPVFVNGTRWAQDLSRGPGRYPETFLPGMGKLTAIAGHRTTFGAPFRKIDRLEAGDPIVLILPYGTFRYLVVGHEIVDNADWRIIRPRGYDALVLSACHPLFSASQRWIVYARLDTVTLADGSSYRVPDERAAAAAAASADG